MLDSIPFSLKALTVIFGGLLIIPLFMPVGRRERGIIYGVELALVFFTWFKVRNATVLLLGRVIWQPKEVDQLRTFLLGVVIITALFLLYQFIPIKSADESEDQSNSKSATSGR